MSVERVEARRQKLASSRKQWTKKREVGRSDLTRVLKTMLDGISQVVRPLSLMKSE